MLKTLRKKISTLRFTLLGIVIFCWLLPTLTLGGYIATRTSSSLRVKTENAIRAGAEYAQSTVVDYLTGCVTLARDAIYDGEIEAALEDYQAGHITYETYYRLIRGYLDRKFSREESCTFALFVLTDDIATPIYTTQGYSESVLFLNQAMEQALELAERLDTRYRFFSVGDQTYLVRNLHNIRMERYGVLVIGVNLAHVLKPITDYAAVWEAAYAVSFDDILLGSFTGGDGLYENKDTLYFTQSVPVQDSVLRYQLQASRRIVYYDMDQFRKLLIGLCVLFVPLCFGVIVFVNHRIVKPVALLSDASERINRGELGVVVPARGMDELGHLCTRFSEMSVQLKMLINKSFKEEIALRDARIKALQSRINPHFINNALESINWQARIDGAENVGKMVETLSVLLNATLDRSNQHLVPLRQELETMEAYFYFVGLQYGDRLTITQNVNPKLLDVPIPRLVVQTLVENAVEHGIAVSGGGWIELNVFARGGHMLIEVINNGKPLSADDLKRIRAILNDKQTDDSHIGIRNVNQRLRLIYQDQAHLTLRVDGRGNTVATIRLPLETPGQPKE